MRYSGRERATLTTYLALIGTILLVVGFGARDVLFERFTARLAPVVVGAADRFVILGGRSTEGEHVTSILTGDPGREVIRYARGFDSDRFGFAATPVEDGVMVVGGTAAGRYTDDILIYHIKTERLERVGGLPSPLTNAVAATVAGKVLVIGGYDGQSRRDEILEVNPADGRVELLGRLPDPRDGHSSVVFQDRLFVLGGEGEGSNPLEDLIELNPHTGSLIREWPLPFAVKTVSVAATRTGIVALASAPGDKDVLLMLDLSGTGSTQVLYRSIELDARKSRLVSVGGELFAVGGAHDTISRQIGVWRVDGSTAAVEPLRFHSRIWH